MVGRGMFDPPLSRSRNADEASATDGATAVAASAQRRRCNARRTDRAVASACRRLTDPRATATAGTAGDAT
eukprot:5615727-Alexandrium_andersonii.AAC.1